MKEIKSEAILNWKSEKERKKEPEDPEEKSVSMYKGEGEAAAEIE